MNLATQEATITVWTGSEIDRHRREWSALVSAGEGDAFRCDPRWLAALCQGLKHEPYVLAAVEDDRFVGVLPLALVKSLLFGRFLVSLPYVNSGGVVAENESVAAALIDRAVELADELDVKYLELRHEEERPHPALKHQVTSKVHMRLALPDTPDELWSRFKPKVRNQVRKGERQGLTADWGGESLLADFYEVFSHNMRDLGTPVFGQELFRQILNEFQGGAELCVVRLANQPIAGALLIHVGDITEVPSASTLRQYNRTNANMFMYWNLLERAIERGSMCSISDAAARTATPIDSSGSGEPSPNRPSGSITFVAARLGRCGPRMRSISG